jgi:hypothetical protein
MWLVIDYVIWSKTSHVLHMASYRLRQLIENLSCDWCGELSMKTIDRKLVMWLIWWVIDNGNWSKTRHIFDVESYQIRQLIENSSCDWYGELSITEIDRKLVIYLMWRVIDYVIWSKTSHVFHMASYRLRQLIKNLSYIWCGELSRKTIDRKLVMWLIWWVIDNGNWSKTRHIFDVASYWLRDLIKN